MTKEQILQVVDDYNSLLHPMAAPIDEQNGGTQLQHARWMCQQIPTFLKENKMEKVNRWLGFVQGILWTNGLFSITQMREHNR